MTTNTLGWKQTARYAVVEPLKAAFEHGNQALVTSASAFMAAMFSMQHNVLPWWIAVPLAVGFEWTYLRGLSTSDKTQADGWASALNWVAMLTSAVYGILYILGHYKVIPEAPDPTAAFWLAVAHVAPMTLLSFCYAGVRRTHKQEQMSEAGRVQRQEETRKHQLQAQEDRLNLDAQHRKAQLHEDYQRQQMDMERLEREQKLEADRVALQQKLILEAEEIRRNQRATARQLVDNSASTTAATRRSPLDGVDVANEVARLGSAAAVARQYNVSRQAVDKKLKK